MFRNCQLVERRNVHVQVVEDLFPDGHGWFGWLLPDSGWSFSRVVGARRIELFSAIPLDGSLGEPSMWDYRSLRPQKRPIFSGLARLEAHCLQPVAL